MSSLLDGLTLLIGPCLLSQISVEEVKYSNADDLAQYDYPPRVIAHMMPTENSEQCTVTFQVTGMNKPFNIPINLIKTKTCLANRSTSGELFQTF